MKISAAIITFNEEQNIARALESLRCCDEIVVADSGSTDRTVELANKLGARVIDSAWRGYAGQKNYASDQCEHDWVLSLDADEALSEALEGELWPPSLSPCAIARAANSARGARLTPLYSECPPE